MPSIIKCFGSSYTKHGQKNWSTWVDFLRLCYKGTKVENFGVAGSSNEYICRQIIKKTQKNSNFDETVIVMWSSFDRTHSEIFLQKNDFNPGREVHFKQIGLTLEQLYERTLEYIWLANQYCKSKKIKILNLSTTLLQLGETKQINNFQDHLDTHYKDWPIDLDSFCLDNKSLVEIKSDPHPSPSQQYKYVRDVICPALELDPFNIDEEQLYQLDLKARKEADGK